MASLMRRRVYKNGKNVTAVVEEELEETKLGRYMGMKKPELELLFSKIKRKDMRIAIINELTKEARRTGRPFKALIQELIAKREKLR